VKISRCSRLINAFFVLQILLAVPFAGIIFGQVKTEEQPKTPQQTKTPAQAIVQEIQNKGFKFKELDEIFDEYKQESTLYKAQ